MVTTSSPPFLVAEIRRAFQTCARKSGETQRLFHNSFNLSRRGTSRGRTQETINTKNPSRPSTIKSRAHNAEERSNPFEEKDHLGRSTIPPLPPQSNQSSPGTRELVPSYPERSSVPATDRRRIPVPLKILPSEQIARDVKLTPRERLHLEVLTRRNPQRTSPKPYRQRLLIYHQGLAREKGVIFSKILAIAGAAFAEGIAVPAHLAYGTPMWLVGMIGVVGMLPITFLHWWTRPWLNRAFLNLPKDARAGPKEAMAYARDLPASATLELEFKRLVPWDGRITVFMADLEAFRGKHKGQSRRKTFKWVGDQADPHAEGVWWKSNPLEFYAMPHSDTGKASRFTIPGIWESVYEQIMTGKPRRLDSEQAATETKTTRWNRQADLDLDLGQTSKNAN